MPRLCTACVLPADKRAALDLELTTHSEAYVKIAARYGLSYGAVRRHEHDHLAHAFRDVKELQSMTDTKLLAAKLEALDAYVQRVLDRGEHAGDDRLVLLGVREGRSNVESLFHIAGLSNVEKRLDALEHPGPQDQGETDDENQS